MINSVNIQQPIGSSYQGGANIVSKQKLQTACDSFNGKSKQCNAEPEKAQWGKVAALTLGSIGLYAAVFHGKSILNAIKNIFIKK